MSYYSILSERYEEGVVTETPEAPDCFPDLNLDQIIEAITTGKQEYNLKPYFYTSLRDVNTIQYRHEVMRDLENKTLLDNIKSFAQKMIIIRRYLALIGKLDFKYHKEGCFLEAAEVYCDAIASLVRDLSLVNLTSRGLTAFFEYLSSYASSGEFTELQADTKEVRTALSTVKYCVIIKDSTVRVRNYEEETDYSTEVEKTFEKFKQGAVKDYLVKLNERSGMNHIEAQILHFVAKLNPDTFASLESYCEQHSRFLNETISVFDREIQFYVTYMDFMARIKRTGLKFCYPGVSEQSKDVFVTEGYDLALAVKRVSENTSVVCNDFYLKENERIFIVSGPNQGGKTTFARMFGQLHFLASLGCPIPGRNAQLFLFDKIYTHFEKEEDIKNLRGKLLDDMVRIHAILDEVTPKSIVIMNEIFTSTTLKDAVFLSKKIMERIIELDLLCVCVTFIDELASLNGKTVSMVSTVVPENPAQRTYKILRMPADGLSYAISIAEKYHLTYKSIKERIQS